MLYLFQAILPGKLGFWGLFRVVVWKLLSYAPPFEKQIEFKVVKRGKEK